MKHKKIIQFYSFIFITSLILITGCTRNVLSKGQDLTPDKKIKSAKVIDLIKEINKNSPESFSLSCTVEGFLENKKFKSAGKFIFSNKPRKTRITFVDAIFQSPLTVITQNMNIINIYFPIEKTLYIDNADMIDLRNYINVDLDYKIITDLIAGKIPVINNFSIKNVMEKIEGEKKIYLILENNEYFQTIVTVGNIPEKLMLINKNSKDRVEIYLKNPVLRKKMVFYRSIKLIKLNSSLKIHIVMKEVQFKKIRNINNIIKIKLPKDCKKIKIN